MKRREEGGQLRVNKWKSRLGSDSVLPAREGERERERGMFNTLYVSLLLLVSVSQHAKNIKPIPLSPDTHTHTDTHSDTLTHIRSRQAEDGNYEQCAAARQQREK